MTVRRFFGIALVWLIGISLAVLGAVGHWGPETSIYVGSQLPSRFEKKTRQLGLIEPKEKIRFFYSDAIFDITSSLYLTTDETLVLYSKHWSEKAIAIPLRSITSVEALYDDSFFVDSMIFVTDEQGNEVSFPLSSEYGRDQKFVAHISRHLSPVDANGDPPELETEEPG